MGTENRSLSKGRQAMKKTIVLFFTLAAVSASAEPLKSKAIKEVICAKAVENVFGYGHPKEQEANATCLSQGTFEVTEEIVNKSLNEVTGLKVDVAFTFNDREFSAEARVLKGYLTNKNGELVSNGWHVYEFVTSNVKDNRDTETMLNDLADLMGGRAEASIEKYDVASFKISEAKKETKSWLGGGESCGYETYTYKAGDTVDWSEFDTYEAEFPEEVMSEFKRLQEEGFFKAIILRGFSSSGESEYCSEAVFRFYTVDGWVLTIFADYNT